MKKKLLKNRNYLLMLTADVIGRFGDSIDAIALSWLTYEISNSPSLSALNFAINFIPSVFFQPFCGAYVEKRDHRKIMVIADSLRFLVISAVALLLVNDKISTPLVMAATFLISTIEAFRLPCQTAIIPRILQKEEFSDGQSLSTTLNSLFEFIGSAAAGTLITLFSLPGVIFFDAACFLISGIVLLFMNYQNSISTDSKSNVLYDTLEGLKYLKKRKDIIAVCLIAISINSMFTVFMSLRSAVCVELFDSGPILLSVISTALMIGNISGSMIYPYLEKKISIKVRLALAYLGVAIFYLNLLLTYRIGLNLYTYPLMIAGPFLIGLAAAMVNIFGMVYMLKVVPEEYISRISSAVVALSMAGQPLSAGLTSLLTTRFSLISIFIVTAAIAFAGSFIMLGNKQFDDININ